MSGLFPNWPLSLAHNISGTRTMEQLADELVLEIVDYLKLSDEYFYEQQSVIPLNSDIWNLSLCNRRLHSILLSSLYHSITITKASQMLGLLHRVMDNPIYGGFVKRLVLLRRENITKWMESGIVSTSRLAGPTPNTEPTCSFIEAAKRAVSSGTLHLQSGKVIYGQGH
ncbi:hypothetical protein CPB86DRAFT_813399 [Serendipita vermifera]|nr:hypothetical protein CPB86DRAFT_813399 [Serendipita vermifera]